MVMLAKDSSDSSDSSSDEDELDFLLVETMFTYSNFKVPRLNLNDLTDDQCETMFR